MAPVLIPLIIAATAVSALGSIRQGQAANAAAKFNAEISRRDAKEAQRGKLVQEENFRRASRRRLAAGRAAAGGSGLVTDTGTPLFNEVAQVLRDEQDALEIRRSGINLKLSGESRAQSLLFQGRAAKKAGQLGAVGALLSGATAIATQKAKSDG